MKTPSLLAALALALMAGGCGFHPLYGSGATSGALARNFSGIYVEPISDLTVANTGYDLRNTLIDVLDANQGAPRYRLTLTLGETTQGIALQNDATITRYNDTLTVTYTLADATSGAVLTKGTESGLSAYNVVQSPYASLAAQQDADKRVAKDIAERIRIDIGVYFDGHRTAQR